VSNDVFNFFEEINEDGFVTPKSKNTSKRNHSSSDSPDTKKMFITVNRFALQTTRNSQNEHNFTENENDTHINDINIRVYKNLQQLRKPTSNKNSNYTNKNIAKNVNNDNVKNTDCEATQQPSTNTFIPQRPNYTYAQDTSPNNSFQIPNNSINENALFNFLNEFKSFINPLLSLLTTVLNSLLSQNVK
jgi:hypothetical protein